jgi:TolB-like protein
VLPLENLSGDPNQEYFADGMTDELITELARIPNLRVVSRTSVMGNKGSKKPLRQIVSELNVDAVVEGSVVRSGDRVRITAQLIDVRSDRHLWAQSFEEQAADAISLQDRVAREIAAQAKLALGPPRREARRIDPAAYDAYLRGLYFLHKRDAAKSMAYIQQAIAIDPGSGAAYAVLSDVLEQQAWTGGSNRRADARVIGCGQAGREVRSRERRSVCSVRQSRDGLCAGLECGGARWGAWYRA